MSRFRLGSLVALAAGILITIGGCAESPAGSGLDALSLSKLPAPQRPSFSRSGNADVASAVIGPEGGSLALGEGHTLVFPAGALSEPTAISMHADGEFVGVRLEPHGLEFPANAAPVLTLNASGATGGFSRLAVVYVDESGQIAEVLPTQTVRGEILQTRLRHFSGYIGAGTRQGYVAP